MRSEPDVRQETSPSNNEKCNICRQGTPSSNTERSGTDVGQGTPSSNTERSGTDVGQSTPPSNTEKLN